LWSRIQSFPILSTFPSAEFSHNPSSEKNLDTLRMLFVDISKINTQQQQSMSYHEVSLDFIPI